MAFPGFLDDAISRQLPALFTDDAVTPVRIEILVDLLRAKHQGLTRGDIYRLLQPKPLDPNPSFTPAKATIRAATELGLAEESGGSVSLVDSAKRIKDTRAAVLKAFDETVLTSTEVEKYLALFYAYLLALGKAVYARSGQSDEDWAKQFNHDVFPGETHQNPFNKDKVSELTNTWLIYVGLGWKDPGGNFQANPYERLGRSLPGIFAKKRKLSLPGARQRRALSAGEPCMGA